MPIPISKLNHLNHAEFTRIVGPVFEHSPWIAENTWSKRPFANVEQLHHALCQTVQAAGHEKQLALICAHPDLVGRAALAGALTRESTGEQASAGLNALSPAVKAGMEKGVLTLVGDENVRAMIITGTGKALQADPRLLLWPEVVEQIAERPLVGYGFGRGLLREPLREDFGTLDSHLWHTHNLVLEALVQGGLSGLVLLAILLGMLLREGWRYARSADERTMACGIALIAVAAGMVVRNMTDTLFVRQNSLFFWGMAGVLLGLPLSGSATSTPAPSAAVARAPRPG